MLFRSKTPSLNSASSHKKEAIPSIITRDMNILGNIVGDGVIDFDGNIDGNIRCHTITVRQHGVIKGEVIADNVFVYGKIVGLVRAKNVSLFGTCHIEGIVMHESITIEDGAFIDGKCKRTDKPQSESDSSSSNQPLPMLEADSEEEAPKGNLKMLENIRLIR